MSGHESSIMDAQYSKDYKLIGSGDDAGKVKIWAVDDSYKLLKTFDTRKENTIWCVSFSYDSKYAVSAGSDCVVYIWNLEKLELH